MSWTWDFEDLVRTSNQVLVTFPPPSRGSVVLLQFPAAKTVVLSTMVSMIGAEMEPAERTLRMEVIKLTYKKSNTNNLSNFEIWCGQEERRSRLEAARVVGRDDVLEGHEAHGRLIGDRYNQTLSRISILN